tara:strand:- start:80 stop:286 length:207 start_codon:yes stop_codon:yes gene_type:complete
MANDNMVLFARKIHFESRWNELFLKNGGVVTPEMSHLGDQIKTTIRLILRNQESPRNIRDGENHIYAS